MEAQKKENIEFYVYIRYYKEKVIDVTKKNSGYR